MKLEPLERKVGFGSVLTVQGPQSGAGFPSLPGAEGERTDG